MYFCLPGILFVSDSPSYDFFRDFQFKTEKKPLWIEVRLHLKDRYAFSAELILIMYLPNKSLTRQTSSPKSWENYHLLGQM